MNSQLEQITIIINVAYQYINLADQKISQRVSLWLCKDFHFKLLS